MVCPYPYNESDVLFVNELFFKKKIFLNQFAKRVRTMSFKDKTETLGFLELTEWVEMNLFCLEMMVTISDEPISHDWNYTTFQVTED